MTFTHYIIEPNYPFIDYSFYFKNAIRIKETSQKETLLKVLNMCKESDDNLFLITYANKKVVNIDEYEKLNEYDCCWIGDNVISFIICKEKIEELIKNVDNVRDYFKEKVKVCFNNKKLLTLIIYDKGNMEEFIKNHYNYELMLVNCDYEIDKPHLKITSQLLPRKMIDYVNTFIKTKYFIVVQSDWDIKSDILFTTYSYDRCHSIYFNNELICVNTMMKDIYEEHRRYYKDKYSYVLDMTEDDDGYYSDIIECEYDIYDYCSDYALEHRALTECHYSPYVFERKDNRGNFFFTYENEEDKENDYTIIDKFDYYKKLITKSNREHKCLF